MSFPPSSKPKHGEMRDHHYESADGDRVHVFNPTCVKSVSERWCASCHTWVRAEGVVGELKFMAEHGDHGQEAK